jgi:hypothetical protein
MKRRWYSVGNVVMERQEGEDERRLLVDLIVNESNGEQWLMVKLFVARNAYSSIEKFGMTMKGEWVAVVEGMPYPESYWLPVKRRRE